MNQKQALAEASGFVGYYRWGDGFKVYYPWRDSNRHGPRTESHHHYWYTTQKVMALAKAQLALWIWCDEGPLSGTEWRGCYRSACDALACAQEDYPQRAHTAAELLAVGVRVLRDILAIHTSIPEGVDN